MNERQQETGADAPALGAGDLKPGGLKTGGRETGAHEPGAHELGAQEPGVKARFEAHARACWERMKANAAEARAAFRRRSERPHTITDTRAPGHRPQDLLAILLLTVGIAVIVLDAPSYPWIRSLPNEYKSFFAAITDIGKSHWILWSSGVFMIASMALDWRALAYRVRMGLVILWTYLAFIFFSVAVSGVIALVLKWVLGRPRPKLYEQVGPLGFDFLAFDVHFTSFPSGHSTTVAAFAAALCLIFPTWLWLIAVAAFWLAFSRIMVGAHYPSDVIAGTLLGLSVTLWTARQLAHRRIGFRFVPGAGLRPTVSTATFLRCLWAFWYEIRRPGLIQRPRSPASASATGPVPAAAATETLSSDDSTPGSQTPVSASGNAKS